MNLIFSKKNWHLIFINILAFAVFFIFYGKFGNIIVDSFREAYIPTQVLNGNALYKDIFTIYTPFAYIFNSFLFKIFGIKLGVLYFAGLFSCIGIINIVYFLASKFLPKIYSLGIVLFIISTACLSPNVFNLFFPYSFGMLYGLLFVLLSLHFSLKGRFCWAYFFYSLSICSKYEFVFLLPILIWFSGRKNLLKNTSAFLVPIIFTLCFLYFQGVRINDLIISAQILLAMASSKTLYWFYSVSGLVFRLEIIPIYLINLAKYLIPILLLTYFRNIWMYICVFCYLGFIINQEILIYAFPLIFILFILELKKLNLKKRFYILSSLALSAKIFFALTLESYGIYFIPFALISIFILTPKKFKKPLLLILFMASFIIFSKNIYSLSKKSVQIKTNTGIVYTSEYYGRNIKNLINYIEQNTQKNDKILILPEGLSVNFLTARESDNKFYSQIPLYVETFGEQLIIDRLKFINPKYIVITNYDTSNYYFSYYGKDYATEIIEYIKKNYTLQKSFANGMTVDIYVND